MKARKWIAVFIVCVMVGIFGITGCGDDSVDYEKMAKFFAEEKVKTMLKSPSTAKFSGWGDTTITKIDDNVYRVKGWFDGTNSFGGTIRSNYKVDIEFIGEKHHRIKDIQIE